MLADILEIKKGDVVSITGSSGKTSLMYLLSRELRENKVLATTTTKIYIPSHDAYDFMHIGGEIEIKNGITVAAESVTPENKLAGFDLDKLNEITAQFDYSFIESDGANKKPLKAWGDYEPVVITRTTKTIGVINVRFLGAEINDEIIHRLNIFKRDFSHGDKVLSLDHLMKIVLHDNGLFKNSEGERVLYINMVETERETSGALRLAEMLKDEKGFLSKIVYGSIKDNRFFVR